jgi:hypothetical protein
MFELAHEIPSRMLLQVHGLVPHLIELPAQIRDVDRAHLGSTAPVDQVKHLFVCGALELIMLMVGSLITGLLGVWIQHRLLVDAHEVQSTHGLGLCLLLGELRASKCRDQEREVALHLP